ncbi:hypothetical protein OC25_23805 [Pedobacter kyungheensis]|uniref:Uncharacterized protein n=1 Tax=Pedobacter kyungheensis TaxID=1069985 RepID=A0A0C1FGI6_9SPHI|nr:hypothetical protein OC25_23805 [Pedobacter kyungheensis]
MFLCVPLKGRIFRYISQREDAAATAHALCMMRLEVMLMIGLLYPIRNQWQDFFLQYFVHFRGTFKLHYIYKK